MDPAFWHTVSALLGALVGGGISYLLNRQQFRNQLELVKAQHRTDFMAETTARDAVERGLEMASAHDLDQPRDLALAARAAATLKSQERRFVAEGDRRNYRIFELPAGDGTLGFGQDITPEADARGQLRRHMEAHMEVLRTISTAVVASLGVIVGMWLERFLIIVPGLAHKPLPYTWGDYAPRPTELVIMLATVPAMSLLYVIFTKFVPIISIWEMKVGNQPHPAVVVDDEEEMAQLWKARP